MSSTKGHVTVRKNTGADIGTQERINFSEGANTTLTITEDPVNHEIDVTIASTGAGGGVQASQIVTVTAGNTESANWNHAQASSDVGATPLEEPESFWWLEIVDANNIIMHIASIDLENNHTFKVLVH